VSDDFIHYQLKYAPFDLVKWIKRVRTKESTTTPQNDSCVSSLLSVRVFITTVVGVDDLGHGGLLVAAERRRLEEKSLLLEQSVSHLHTLSVH